MHTDNVPVKILKYTLLIKIPFDRYNKTNDFTLLMIKIGLEIEMQRSLAYPSDQRKSDIDLCRA